MENSQNNPAYQALPNLLQTKRSLPSYQISEFEAVGSYMRNFTVLANAVWFSSPSMQLILRLTCIILHYSYAK